MRVIELIGQIKGIEGLVHLYGSNLTAQELIEMPKKKMMRAKHVGPKIAEKIKTLMDKKISEEFCKPLKSPIDKQES